MTCAQLALMQNSQKGTLNLKALVVMKEAADLMRELRLTLEIRRMLMHERREILRDQSQIAVKSARQVQAMDRELSNCLWAGRAVE